MKKKSPDSLFAGTWLRRIFWAVVLLALYLVSSIPVGLFLYSLKNHMEWDVFSVGGYHSFMHCFNKEIRLATQGRNAEEQRKHNEAHGAAHGIEEAVE